MTVRHVVSFRLAADDPAVRAAQAAELAAQVRALAGRVPQIQAVSAGVGTTEGNWDLALVVDVADRDALAAYAVHPEHQKVLAAVRAVMSERVAVDFEL